MQLPQSQVEAIFAKLSIAYGHRFLSIWDGLPLEAVKADWALQLSGVSEQRIVWALQHLPERAPDAPAFRALCMRMPEPGKPLSLPHGPKAPAPNIARVLAEQLHNTPKDAEPERVRWARRFIAMWGRPEAKPTFAQRENLALARRIVERFEAPAGDALALLKAETAQRVEAYAEGAQP